MIRSLTLLLLLGFLMACAQYREPVANCFSFVAHASEEVCDFEPFDVLGNGQVRIDATHYVSTAITVGSGPNTFDLEVGDLL